MLVACEAFVQIVFHPQSDVDGEWSHECSQLVFRVFCEVGEHLCLECRIKRVEPVTESFVTDVTVQTQNVIPNLIIVNRIFRCSIDSGFPFQFVGELYLVFVIVINEVLAVGQV